MKRKSIFYLAGIIAFVVTFGIASNVFIERTQALPANPSIDGEEAPHDVISNPSAV